MKFISVLATATAALSIGITACGSDSSSSNVEREEESSSSAEEVSSSSEEASSSSVEEKSDLPKGTRAATLEDLGKYYSLPLFGTDIILATGAKQGVFSLWDSEETAWVAFRSEFKDGVLEFSEKSKTGGFLGADTPVADSLSKLYKKGAQIQIIVNEKDSTLRYSLNGGDYSELASAKVVGASGVLTSGDKLKGQVLSCKAGKTTTDYTFFEGRYFAESGDEWEAGFYDIQHSRLLMVPTFLEKESYQPLVTMNVASDFSSMTDVTGEEFTCKATSVKFENIESDKIAGMWVASGDGYDWTLNLAKSGKYSVVAKKMNATALDNSGTWVVYGNTLIIKNSSCSEPSKCLTSIKGVISGFDAKKGFSLDHSNTQEPAMPTVWTLPQYDD